MARLKFKDPNGRHIRVYATLLNSPAFRVLSFAAKALFVDLREGVTGTNNGALSAPLTILRHKGWTAPATLSKALYELRAMGFIAVTREGGLKQGTRVCALYRFTDLEVFEQPKQGIQAVKATHEYLDFKTVGDAERGLIAGVQALHDAGVKKQLSKTGRKKLPVQKLNRINSKNELETHFISSKIEQGKRLSVQKLNREILA